MSGSIDRLPRDRRPALRTARRLTAITVVYLCSTVTLLILVMGRSQALKTEFIADALSMVAPLLFLVGDHISGRAPSDRYPYGFAGVVSAAYLSAAVTLMLIGGYLLWDAAAKLIAVEHPTLGGITILGRHVWLGWPAIAVLVWCALPSFFLGRAKQKAAETLHDKVLLASAKTSAANWQSASVAIIGLLGVGAGVWWLDAAAACFISVEIIRSGFSEVRSAVEDLLDRRPETLDGELDPLPERLTALLKKTPWIADAVVRVREEGREFKAEAFVAVREDEDLVRRIETAGRKACALDWRLKEMVIMPVRRIPSRLDAIRVDADPAPEA